MMWMEALGKVVLKVEITRDGVSATIILLRLLYPMWRIILRMERLVGMRGIKWRRSSHLAPDKLMPWVLCGLNEESVRRRLESPIIRVRTFGGTESWPHSALLSACSQFGCCVGSGGLFSLVVRGMSKIEGILGEFKFNESKFGGAVGRAIRGIGKAMSGLGWSSNEGIEPFLAGFLPLKCAMLVSNLG